MKSNRLKPSVSALALILGIAIIFLLTGAEKASAQEETFGDKPLIKESQKTDRNEKLREELVELDKLILREPQNILAYQYRASHHYELKQYQQAIDDHSRVIALNPNYLKTYLERASCYRELEQYDKALEDLDHVISRAARVADARGYDAYDAYLGRYLIHLKLNEDKKAIADLSGILAFRPNDEWAYQSRADIYRMSRQYEKAIADYTQLIKISPRSTYGYYGRAEIYKAIGEPQKAAADTKAAEEIIKKRGF